MSFRRNLLFHLFPMAQGPIWRWHAEKLIQHKDVFNGRRVVSVVLDGRCVSPPEVINALAPLEAEIHFNENSDNLCEGAHFIRMLGGLESQNPDEATFYGHAKGVTRRDRELEAVKLWCEAMYEMGLGEIECVDRLLETHASVGSFRVFMEHSGSSWHYSGTFFWLKHSTLFSRDWKKIDRNGRFGVEGYPGLHIKPEESAALTPDGVNAVDLYGGNIVSARNIKVWKAALHRRFA